MDGYLSIPNVLSSRKVDYAMDTTAATPNSVLKIFINDAELKNVSSQIEIGQPASLCYGMGGTKKYSLELIDVCLDKYMKFKII